MEGGRGRFFFCFESHTTYNVCDSHVLHDQLQFLLCGDAVGLPQRANDLCFAWAHQEIVVLRWHVDDKKVVRQETSTNVADVGQLDPPSDLDRTWFCIVDCTICSDYSDVRWLA